MTEELLMPEFVRELEAMRRFLRPRARSGQIGSATARRVGQGPEFHEHRAYSAGDDMGRIDWLAFARTGQPVLKANRAEEDVVVRILIDGSASLGFGDPPKLDVAKRIAAGVAYLALAASERAQVTVTPGQRGVDTSPQVRGRAALGTLLRAISRIEAGGATDLAAAIARVLSRAARPGLLVVVSDFFDPGPVTDALRRARFEGHDVALVQVLSKEDCAPDLTGDLTLVDAETSTTLDVTLDHAAVGAYLARLEGLFSSLRTFARTARATYVRAETTAPLAEILRKIVAAAVD